jgi:hypothetical protein
MHEESTGTRAGKAVLVRKLTGFTGSAKLYRLDPPLEGNEFVAVSATVAYRWPETYIFPADESGNVLDWGELDGSFRGALDHAAALEGAGYEVIS